MLGWAAQGGGAVTHFAGIQGTFRCVEGRGIVRAVGDRWTVGLSDLVGLFPTLLMLRFYDLSYLGESMSSHLSKISSSLPGAILVVHPQSMGLSDCSG